MYATSGKVMNELNRLTSIPNFWRIRISRGTDH